MILIDVYMLPWPRRSPQTHHQPQGDPWRYLAQLAGHRKVHRLAAVAAAVVAYAKLRLAVACACGHCSM